jgi:signal peptidase I
MISISWKFSPTSILGIRTFNISTEAGEPGVLVGDKVIADMKVYDTKSPDYGDIVAYKTDDGLIWTFRVVGLPNDTIQLVNNVVSINSKRTRSRLIAEKFPFQVLEEQSPNGSKRMIQRAVVPLDSAKKNIRDIVVPSDSYYLLGDSRDNAYDSRFVGPVKKVNIIGQMIYTIWGKSLDRINIDLRGK